MSKEVIKGDASKIVLVNYEQVCARMGIEIADRCQNKQIKKSEIIGTLNKSIGVLQSSGIYAFAIWLEYRKASSDKTASEVQKTVYELIKNYAREFNIWANDEDSVTPDKVKQFVNHENVSIEELFLLKGLLQKMLTYGLYSARALAVNSNNVLQEQDGKLQ